MSIQDLFGKNVGIKGSSAESLESQARSVESEDFTTERLKEKQRFIPQIDFSNPANFARYGLAQKYYSDAFTYIADNYPYDGSLAEKLEWENSASLVDLWVFENEFPRTNGFVRLGQDYGTLSSTQNAYSLPSNLEFISLRGTLQTASVGMEGKPLAETFDKANEFDSSKKRENNLALDGNDGITLEFWLLRSSSVATESDKQVIFDVWNQQTFGAANYGRFRVEIHPDVAGEQDKFYFELVSGTSGAGYNTPVAIGSGLPITSSTWNHYALSFANSGSTLVARLYQNGEFVSSVVTGTAINEVSGNYVANVGALRTSVSGTWGDNGWAKLSGSLDELRFWKTRRTAEQIGRYWFSQVGGGANTDDSNVELGLYYKFNEGITNSSNDAIILDYSGRIANGSWVGYSSGRRSTGSAMVLAGAASSEFLDPIIYTNHPDYVANKERLEASGTIHDDTNNSALYNSFPSWIVRQDQRKGRKVLENLVQTIASYFDTLHLQIQNLPAITNRNYTSGSTAKPRSYAQRLLENAGFPAPDIFQDALALEAIGNRSDTELFEEKFFDVRNRIYENIHNNLIFINKMKGTQEAARNLIRCFGVGEEIVRLNLYANNIDFDLKDKFRQIVHRTNVVDFNDPDRFDSSVYQTSSTADERSYINFNEAQTYRGQTFECDVIFPKKFDRSSPLYFSTSFLTSSIYGAHEARSIETNYGWDPTDVGNFQVQVIRKELESEDAYFQLTGTDGFVLPNLTSSVFKDVYDNSRWIFSVVVKHPSVFGGTLTGSENLDYEVEFSGYNYLLDTEQNSFKLTGTISTANGTSFLTSRKRMFVGSHRTNFTGSVRELSDVKVSALRAWIVPLDDEALIQHAKDPTNFGTLNPYRSTFLSASASGSSDPDTFLFPEMGSLALHWSFDNVTSSGPSSDGSPTTSDATFKVEDLSSGSSFIQSQFGDFSTTINVKHPGRGDFFLPNSQDVVQREFLNAAKLQFPDVLTSDDLVRIITEEEEKIQTKDSRPIDFFYVLEKSMSQVISDQMINYFGTIKNFNSLIGDPVELYQKDYKRLEKIRQFFFEKVENEPDQEKFVEFFKWIDDSISRMVYELLPASANFSPQVRNVVESHILERNKFWFKLPTLEFKGNEPLDDIDVITITGSKLSNPEDNVELTRGWNKQKVVSIENVKNDRASQVISASVRDAHQPLGNYARDYEIVQLTGRSTNNRFLVKKNAELTGAIFTLSKQASNVDIADYELPDRTATGIKNKFIFVNRFSAPGEPATLSPGGLDVFAQEFSVYNEINQRNGNVREALNEFWKIHTQANLSSSTYTGQPNFHKVNRNSLSRSNGTIYNNYFFTSLIPQSELRYAWITASIDLTASQPVGFTSDFSTPSGSVSVPSDNIIFITGSSIISGSFQDFVGLNNFIIDEVFTGSNFLSSSTGRYQNEDLYQLTPALEQHLLHLKRNGPYQGSSFKLSGKTDHPVARSLRKNNIISLINNPPDRVVVDNNGNRRVYRDLRGDTFTNYDEPAVLYKFKPLINIFNVRGSKDPVSLRHSYANNIKKFSNVELNNKLGLDDCFPQTYDRLKEFYLDTDLTGAENPIEGFIRFTYSEVIYPKEKNAGKKKVRIRTNYQEDAFVEIQTLNGFWDPLPNANNKIGALAVPTLTNNSIDRPPLERRTIWHSDVRRRNRYAGIDGGRNADEFYTTTVTNSMGYKNGLTPSIFPFGVELFHSESTPTPGISGDSTMARTFGNWDFGELDEGCFKNMGSYTNNGWGGNVEFAASSYKNDWMRLDRIPIRFYAQYITASVCYINNPWHTNVRALGEAFALQMGQLFPQWRNSWFHRFRIPALTSGSKFPAYDTYEEFSADIRYMGKDYSTIPEFRISDHMPYYVEERGGNFRARNDQFLEMIGGEITKSANDQTTGFTENFFKLFAHTDELTHFETFVRDHGEDTEVSRISLTCKGIKKFLPYNGIYPANRTLQLASLFSQSLGPNISGLSHSVGKPTEEVINNNILPSGALAVQSLMQPFFAPGILFNSIKSGLAVDVPVFTGSFVKAEEGFGGAAFVFSQSANYRFNFETLVDLVNGDGQGGIPIYESEDDEKNIFFLRHSNLNPNDYETDYRFPFFKWNGEETSALYRLGMQNFLASTIDFFLRDQNLKAIYSAPQKEFKNFENGKSYYMDIRVRKSRELLMYGDYFNSTDGLLRHSGTVAGGQDENEPLVEKRGFLGYTGRFFGEPFFFKGSESSWVGLSISGATADGAGLEWNYLQHSDAAFAPYLPCYWWDDSYVRIKYTSDGQENLNSSDIITKIQSNLELEHFNFGLLEHMKFYNNDDETQTKEKSAWISRQTVTSSLQIFGLTQQQKITYDPNNFDPVSNRASPISAEDPENSKFNRWVIYPRMEFPVLNFANQPRENYTIYHHNGGDVGIIGNRADAARTWITATVGATETYPQAPLSGTLFAITKGMWSGYGEFPEGSTGIFFSVEESFPDLPPGDGEGTRGLTGSLIDVLGFDTGEKRIGEIADSREVFEAIVAIPFVDEPVVDGGFAKTVNVMGRNFFAISRQNYDYQKRNVANGRPAIQSGGRFGDLEVDETSISKLSQAMRKFVIPPEMNFDLYDDIPPFVAYFMEFSHTFSRQDLADIWQNVLPELGTKAEKDEVTFSHEMEPWEFFEGKKLPSRIRWLVFKVKQKAEWSYFAKTADTRDDARFRFDFRTQQNVVPDYSYNYPYDFFSLVELAKIEAEIDIEPKRDRRRFIPKLSTTGKTIQPASREQIEARITAPQREPLSPIQRASELAARSIRQTTGLFGSTFDD